MSVPRASIIMTTASCGGSSGRMKPAARSWRRFARAGWLPACRSGRTSAPPARAALLETWLLLVTGLRCKMALRGAAAAVGLRYEQDCVGSCPAQTGEQCTRAGGAARYLHSPRVRLCDAPSGA